MKRFRHGLVAGRFAPFHAGHQRLVAEAVRQCERVSVEVLSERDESVPVEVRAAWIRELHPDVGVIVVEPPVLDEMAVVTATDFRHWFGKVMRDHLPARVDAVFTADTPDAYDQEFLESLGGATQVFVDSGRRRVPISGKSVRENPERFWSMLAPPVRAWYVQRVVVTGGRPEEVDRVGRAVAEALGCAWTPTPAAPGTAGPAGSAGSGWSEESDQPEESATARLGRQQRAELKAARRAPTRWLVVDSDPVTIRAEERSRTGRVAPADVPSQAPREPWESATALRRPATRLYVVVASDDAEGTGGTAALRSDLEARSASWVEVDADQDAVARVLDQLPELRLPSVSGIATEPDAPRG